MAKKKRGNNEGSIYEHRRNGKKVGYRGAYTDHLSGKRHYVSGKTRTEVAEKLNKAQADRDSGLTFDAGALTVGEYLDRWLTDSVANTVRASTYERYEYAIRPHIRPALGKIKLKSLTPAHVRGLYQQKLNSGLAPATVHKMHVVLHKALKQAVRDGLIPRNVTEAVDPPQIPREEISPLSSEEATRLLTAAAGERYEALYVLAVHTGMRQGEILGLKWEDIDLEAYTLQVKRTLTRDGGKVHLSEPKTPKSRRLLNLTPQTVAALREHRKRQMEERMEYAGLYSDQGLVFTTHTGAPVNPKNLTDRSFKPLLRKAELPDIRFHDLRHTAATLLLARGVHPKIVSELLGHSNISITLDTYSHVLPGMGDVAAKAMEEALG